MELGFPHVCSYISHNSIGEKKKDEFLIVILESKGYKKGVIKIKNKERCICCHNSTGPYFEGQFYLLEENNNCWCIFTYKNDENEISTSDLSYYLFNNRTTEECLVEDYEVFAISLL